MTLALYKIKSLLSDWFVFFRVIMHNLSLDQYMNKIHKMHNHLVMQLFVLFIALLTKKKHLPPACTVPLEALISWLSDHYSCRCEVAGYWSVRLNGSPILSLSKQMLSQEKLVIWIWYHQKNSLFQTQPLLVIHSSIR